LVRPRCVLEFLKLRPSRLVCSEYVCDLIPLLFLASPFLSWVQFNFSRIQHEYSKDLLKVSLLLRVLDPFSFRLSALVPG